MKGKKLFACLLSLACMLSVGAAMSACGGKDGSSSAEKSEIEQIYAHCRLEQVGLLLIEDAKRRKLLSCEKAVIITEDLCEILENYEEIC